MMEIVFKIIRDGEMVIIANLFYNWQTKADSFWMVSFFEPVKNSVHGKSKAITRIADYQLRLFQRNTNYSIYFIMPNRIAQQIIQ